MAEESGKEKEVSDSARADADKRADEMFDKMLKGIDSIRSDVGAAFKRLDAIEEEKKADAAKADAAKADAAAKADDFPEDMKKKEEKKDAEGCDEDTKAKELAADKAKKDSEDDDKKEEKKMDAARADAVEALSVRNRDLERRLDELTLMVRRPMADSHREELLSAQSRADEILIQLGKRAPQPMVGEAPLDYRRRVVSDLKPLSPQWKEIKLDSFDEQAFSLAEKMIYSDAVVAAKRPTDIAPGRMREVRKVQPTGHIVTEFYGDSHFVKGFSRKPRRVASIYTGR